MPTLIELAQHDADMIEMLAESEGDVTPALAGMMATLELTTQAKLDNYFHILSSYEAVEAAQKAGAEFYDKRARILKDGAKAAANKAQRLVRLIEWFMNFTGRTEVRGSSERFQLEAVGGQVPLLLKDADPSHFPERFLKRTVAVDTDALRAAIELGDPEALKFATLTPRRTHVVRRAIGAAQRRESAA